MCWATSSSCTAPLMSCSYRSSAARLLELLQAGRRVQYAAVARTMLVTATVIAVVAVLGELWMLPRLAWMLRVVDAHTLTFSAVVLSLSFFFTAGLQAWIWPAFVFFERPWRCTLWGAIGVIAGQYILGPALFHLVGDGNPVWFCVGYLAYYPLSLLPLWRELQRERHSALTWSAPQVVTT